jgi:hypothetical protein
MTRNSKGSFVFHQIKALFCAVLFLPCIAMQGSAETQTSADELKLDLLKTRYEFTKSENNRRNLIQHYEMLIEKYCETNHEKPLAERYFSAKPLCTQYALNVLNLDAENAKAICLQAGSLALSCRKRLGLAPADANVNLQIEQALLKAERARKLQKSTVPKTVVEPDHKLSELKKQYQKKPVPPLRDQIAAIYRSRMRKHCPAIDASGNFNHGFHTGIKPLCVQNSKELLSLIPEDARAQCYLQGERSAVCLHLPPIMKQPSTTPRPRNSSNQIRTF